MGMYSELRDCYYKHKNSPQELISSYSERLIGQEERGLFEAAARLLGAYYASPAFSKSRQLDMLAEHNDDMKILRILMRQHGSGVVEILKTYDEYFGSKDKTDFWTFFNHKLELPDDWYREAKLEITVEEGEDI